MRIKLQSYSRLRTIEALRLCRTFGIVNTCSQLGWTHYEGSQLEQVIVFRKTEPPFDSTSFRSGPRSFDCAQEVPSTSWPKNGHGVYPERS